MSSEHYFFIFLLPKLEFRAGVKFAQWVGGAPRPPPPGSATVAMILDIMLL